MDDVHSQFFYLLRCALHNERPDSAIFSSVAGVRWHELYQMAAQQALLGVIYDVVSALPESIQPERPLRLKWFMAVQRIEQANLKLNKVLADIAHLMQKQQTDFFLLKGQGVASFYPNPLRRQSGDIDLLFPSATDFQKAHTWLRTMNLPDAVSVKHISFNMEGAHIEFHDRLEEMHYPPANRVMQQHFASYLEKGEYESLTVQGCRIKGLPPEVNLVYMMLHILNHLLTGGIGLRQWCDWALYAKYHQGKTDTGLMTRLLEKTGLTRFANAFAQIQHDYLGVPTAAIPYYFDTEPLSDCLLADILEGGNFGYHRKGKKRPAGKWRGKLHTADKIIRRGYRFFQLSPAEAFWFPVHYSVCNVRMFLNERI